MNKRGAHDTFITAPSGVMYRVRTKKNKYFKKCYRLEVKNLETKTKLYLEKVKAFRSQFIHDVVRELAETESPVNRRIREAKEEREVIFKRQIKQYTNREHRRGNLDNPYGGSNVETETYTHCDHLDFFMHDWDFSFSKKRKRRKRY